MTTALLASIPDTASVAASRLLDPDIWNQLAAEHAIIEVPHVRCDPVPITVEPSVLRLRCWPNIGGRLERGAPSDLVAWFPSLAPHPDCGTIVPMTTSHIAHTTERIRLLGSLLKHVEQIRGVTGVCVPEAACTIIYTSGVDPAGLSALADSYPGSVAPTPSRLAEFPGGIRITITNEVCSSEEAFASDLTSLLRR